MGLILLYMVGTSNKSDPGIPIEYNARSGVLLVGSCGYIAEAFLPRDPHGPGPHEFTIQLSARLPVI